MLGVIACQYPTSGVSNESLMVEAWLPTLAEFDQKHVWQAFEDEAAQSGAFPPNVRQIASSAKLRLFPLLALNPIEHKLQNTLFYRIYCAKYGNPPSHNVRGDADSFDKWMNKYASHMKKSIADMMAASNERVERYIQQMTVNLEKFERTKIEDHSEAEPEKPISPAFIAKYKKEFAEKMALIEQGPQEPTEETKARWERNRKDYAEKVMRRIDGLKPTQSYTIEVPADDPGHGLVYTCKRTKYLRGEQSIEPRSGAVRTYLD